MVMEHMTIEWYAADYLVPNQPMLCERESSCANVVKQIRRFKCEFGLPFIELETRTTIKCFDVVSISSYLQTERHNLPTIQASRWLRCFARFCAAFRVPRVLLDQKTVWHVTFSLRWHRPHLHCQVQAGNSTYQGSSCVFHLPNGASFISILVLPMKANNWWCIDASCFMDPCMENFHSLLCRVAMVFSKDHLVVAVDTWAEDSWPAGVGKAARWTRFAEDSAHRHQAPDRADMAIHHSCYP